MIRPPRVARSITRAAMLTSTPSQSEPMRCGRPVWMPARIRGVIPVHLNGFHRFAGGDRGGDGGQRIGEHRHHPVAHPFDDVPAGVEQRRLGLLGDAAQQAQRGSSPACSDQVEKPTRSVNTSVTSALAGLPDTFSVTACHSCKCAQAHLPGGGLAVGHAGGLRRGQRPALRPPRPPTAGHRTRDRRAAACRARRIRAMRSGLWLVLRSHPEVPSGAGPRRSSLGSTSTLTA